MKYHRFLKFEYSEINKDYIATEANENSEGLLTKSIAFENANCFILENGGELFFKDTKNNLTTLSSLSNNLIDCGNASSFYSIFQKIDCGGAL